MTESTNSPNVLDAARRLIYGDRADAYGPWSENAGGLADRWSILLGVAVTPGQVTLMLVELKLMRLAQDPEHTDSVIDAIGYLALYADLILTADNASTEDTPACQHPENASHEKSVNRPTASTSSLPPQ